MLIRIIHGPLPWNILLSILAIVLFSFLLTAITVRADGAGGDPFPESGGTIAVEADSGETCEPSTETEALPEYLELYFLIIPAIV